MSYLYVRYYGMTYNQTTSSKHIQQCVRYLVGALQYGYSYSDMTTIVDFQL